MIWRVDARRSQEANPANRIGGTISGNLRATRGDGAIWPFDGRQFPAIRFVRAGYQLTGDLIADGERDSNGNPVFDPGTFETWGSIRRVVVGGADENDPSPGIRGDILAEYGVIGEVFSTGQIGNGPAAADRSNIRAGIRIESIRTRDDASVGDEGVLNRPIYAEIETSMQEINNFERESTLYLLETEGDFHGSIRTVEILGTESNKPRRESGRYGVFVGGDFHGSIDVDYSVDYASLIARSFRGPVRIGQMLKGPVVAVGREGSTDPLDGTIESIEVGYATSLTNAPRPHGRGFCAHNADFLPPPFEGVGAGGVINRDKWYTSIGNENGFIPDSVIRADKRIGTVRLASISGTLSARSEQKYARPRVESPEIVNLTIDKFDSGAVWSGKLNSTTSTVTNDIEDDWSYIHEVRIGCMGPKADLWVKDAAVLDIDGDVFGEIHMPDLGATETLRIGERLGDLVQAKEQIGLCYAERAGGETGSIESYQFTQDEPSPRGRWISVEDAPDPDFLTSGISAYGRILIRKPALLHGQIILHAANFGATQKPLTHWLGDILIGTGLPNNWNQPGTPFVISTNSSRASTGGIGPNYSSLSAALGGGAVGLVPFSRHASDCLPLQGQAPCGFSFPQRTWPTAGGFNGGTRETFVLRHYGPVFDWKDASVFGRDFDRAAVRPLKIERQANVVFCPLPPPNPCPAPVWEDVTSQFHVYVPGQSTTATLAASREVWVAPVDSPYRINRNYNYRFTVAVDPVYGPLLRCDRTFTPTNPPAAIGYPYEFFPICIIEGGSDLMTWNDLPAFSTQPTDFTGDGIEDFADVVRAVERLSGEEE